MSLGCFCGVFGVVKLSLRKCLGSLGRLCGSVWCRYVVSAGVFGVVKQFPVIWNDFVAFVPGGSSLMFDFTTVSCIPGGHKK